MSVIWDKVWSDLWHHKVRTLLAVLSIAVGVFALGAIFGLIDQLTPNLTRMHLRIVPAHIGMDLLDTVDQDTIDALKNIDGVVDIEALNQMPIRYRRSSDEAWQSGILFMRDDYIDQQYNQFILQGGEWPRRNTVGVDIRASDYLGLSFGDTVIFEMDGTDRALPVTGSIRYHYITSPDFGSDAHFFVDEKGLERFGIPAGQFNELLIRVEPYSEDFARAVASEIKDRLAKQNVDVAITYYNDPNEHWAQQFFDGLYLVLQLLAVVSLFLSVVLIFNTLTALITQQTNQIGAIKAIGGRTGTIIKIYLAGVLVYGTLALLLALPLGAWVAAAMTAYFLDIFNVAYGDFQVAPRALAVQAGAAIGIPVLAALWPVLRGARMSVRAAIASYGLGVGLGGGPVDRLVEWIGQRLLSAPHALALGNLFRRKGRLVLTLLVLTVAGTLFLIVMTLSSSITLTVDTELARRGYEVRLTFKEHQRSSRLVALAQELPEVERAEVWFNQPAALLRAGQRTQDAGEGAMLVGLPVDSGMYQPKIVVGRWLLPGDERAIVMDEEMAEDNHVTVGDIVTLDMGEMGDDPWQVVGLYQEIQIVSAPDAIYAPRDAVLRAANKYDLGRELLVRTRSGSAAEVTAVTTQLKTLFEQRHWDIANSQTLQEDRLFFDSFFAQYIPMLLVLAIIMAVVGGIGLMGTLSISVLERTREIGVMRAIGAQTPVMLGMFILEGILQGMISWAIAVPLSFTVGKPLAALMGQAMFHIDLDYQYNTPAVLIWLVAVLLIALLASIIPARNATRVSVRESLAYA